MANLILVKTFYRPEKQSEFIAFAMAPTDAGGAQLALNASMGEGIEHLVERFGLGTAEYDKAATDHFIREVYNCEVNGASDLRSGQTVSGWKDTSGVWHYKPDDRARTAYESRKNCRVTEA